MREIRFRALAVVNDKHNNIKVGDFVYGHYIESGCDAPCIIFGDGEQIEVDKNTLGQLTGVKDIYETPTYEGDIVESDYYLPNFKCVAAVKYVAVDNVGKFGFDNGEGDAFIFGNLTIVGNIHKNIELLKGDRS